MLDDLWLCRIFGIWFRLHVASRHLVTERYEHKMTNKIHRSCLILVTTAYLLLVFCNSRLEGEMAMSTEDINLTWEWPAGRMPDYKIMINVHDVKSVSRGIFGLRNSPSIANHFPDPVILRGVVLAPDGVKDKTVTIWMPRIEVRDVKAGDNVGLGLIGTDVCICVAQSPEHLKKEAFAVWLEQMSCS